MTDDLKTFHLPTFTLESGETLRDVQVAYRTYGRLSEKQDNVVVVIHALTANADVHEWWSGLFGTGKVFDPDQYFIICPNNLGSPYGTTSPLNRQGSHDSGKEADFPFYTIRDTALLHLSLLEYLDIGCIFLLIGPSCGGNIAQEMAYYSGEKVKNLALLCCSAQESPWVIVIHEAQRQALLIDPGFISGSGKGQGLVAARAMAMPFYRSHASFTLRQSESHDHVIRDFRASSYIAYQGRKFLDRFDARCYYHLINALDTHHMGRSRNSIREALAQIKANTICMGFSSDILVPTIEQKAMAELIPGAKFMEIETIFGHDAFLIEAEKVNRALCDFLEDCTES